MRIDDAVDAIPVHFGNGIWGCIAVGLFAEPTRVINAYSEHGNYGVVYGTGANLLGAQVVGILWIIAWVAAIMTPYFLLLNVAGMFRVDSMEEEVGMDIFHHKGAAYDISGPSEDSIRKFERSRSEDRLQVSQRSLSQRSRSGERLQVSVQENEPVSDVKEPTAENA